MTRKFQEYLKGKRDREGELFDTSDLSEQFVPYFESGQRIEVKTVFGTHRGYVGVTAGRRPSFLLLVRRDSRSSFILLSDTDTVLKQIPGKFRDGSGPGVRV